MTVWKNVDEFEKCIIEKLATDANCTTLCYPIIYNFLPDYQPCNSSDDFACMYYFLLNPDWRYLRYECLKSKKSVQYKANFFQSSKIQTNGTGFVFVYYFDKGTKDVKEEVQIVTAGNFIGSVGGSLGLFLGFSCFTYLSGFIDKVLP